MRLLTNNLKVSAFLIKKTVKLRGIKNPTICLFRLAKAYFKAVLNNRSIAGGQNFEFHTVDYVRNGIRPMMLSTVRTIINIQRFDLTVFMVF